MKQALSLTMAQNWIARFHPDYSIMQALDGAIYAVPPTELDMAARRGFLTLESPQQSGAYQTGETRDEDAA